jgi:uncharacterized protein (DUF488 family)
MGSARRAEDTASPTLWTVGHSTRALDQFIALLHTHGVDTLVDVRTVPRSRRHPQFEKTALTESLPAAGIAYAHMPGLGGLRKPRKDSPNTGWRNESFRGYADYMQTDDFARHVEALVKLATRGRVAVMCAEAVPWRCHRSLVADALLARGVEVEHILGPGPRHPHRLTPLARLDGGRLTYPGDEPDETPTTDQTRASTSTLPAQRTRATN